MLRRNLARCIATQHVASRSLRPVCHVPRHSTYGVSSTWRLASSNTSEASHDSLTKFLNYAKRSQLDRNSTTYLGTYYEYAAQALLRKYGFTLRRVGGRGDRGVDLKGTWTISTEREKQPGSTDDQTQKIEAEIPVVVQCKRLKTKVGPNLIRELEGALVGRSHTLAVLVGTNGATKGVRDAMGRSRVGICWICLEVEGGGSGEEVAEDKEQGFDGVLQTMKDEIVSKAPGPVKGLLDSSCERSSSSDESGQDESAPLGRVRQMLWNRAASAMGLEGLDVVMKYDGSSDESGEVGKEVLLMWQGKKVRETLETD